MMARILPTREDLAGYFNELGYTYGVEVGTHQGVFADKFMHHFFGRMVCVDPWEGDAREYFPAFFERPNTGDFDYEVAKLALSRHAGRVELWRTSSKAASRRFVDNSLCFVYLDGAHDIPNVKLDIMTWWPKVKKGGTLAGHDYAPDDPTLMGVAAVVNWFCAEHGLDLNATHEPSSPRSWFIRKPD